MKNVLMMFLNFRLNPYEEMVVIFTAISVFFFAIFSPDFERSLVVTTVFPDLVLKLPLWLRVFSDLIGITFLVRALFFFYRLFINNGKDSMGKDAFIAWVVVLPLLYGALGLFYNFSLDLFYLYIAGLLLGVYYGAKIIKNRRQNTYGFFLLAISFGLATAFFDGGLAGIIIFFFLAFFYYFSYKLFAQNL